MSALRILYLFPLITAAIFTVVLSFMELMCDSTYSVVVVFGGRGLPGFHRIAIRQKDVSASPGTKERGYEVGGTGTERKNCPPPVW